MASDEQTYTERGITGYMIPVTAIQAGDIAASGTSTSDAYDMNKFGARGYFSVQYTITGDGTAKIEYLCSNDGVTYVVPDNAVDIATALTKTSGAGSDGKGFLDFSPEPCRFLKLRATETGGANSVNVTLELLMQG